MRTGMRSLTQGGISWPFRGEIDSQAFSAKVTESGYTRNIARFDPNNLSTNTNHLHLLAVSTPAFP